LFWRGVSLWRSYPRPAPRSIPQALGDYVLRFFLPTISSNLFGGVALAALVNHAPVEHEIAAKAREDG
jgi:hypothetical protein